ncbi:ADP-ribosylation factor-related protein 1-like [Actinia tenebrosa]|uniref:ADP-ribosylation factor-like protein 6 n=1 Tax=Actinia tenebrosa TaxID=6105 RepID=A0A6P8H2Y4_ACTTE|nr:ADP-ribosylation factor-related protein 1-like [Actinia tenebrosa]XP_031549800.1 ADP-ribosylation factor-related protein 1-like [Actinia tenebrosa]XP_031549801.1 ADP-ribosylation factor-related protein 1-like [Actinia tenebrosa]XP_031549802.1 ADP-ribosylation factor-related protein 1-like [Actinia tenebrosa]
MFTLFSGLWKYLFRKDEYFILILGLDNAGKTTFLEQIKRTFSSSYSGIPFEKISPTVGMNVGKIAVNGIKLIFWDLGGQLELRSLWNKYFEECHGVIFVIDSSDEKRLEESHNAFDEALKHEFLKGVPLLVLANKQDVPGSLSVDKIQSVFHPECAILDGRQCFIQPTSALQGDGIEPGILWIADQVKQNLDRPPRQKDIS